jgi:hypothetical protein
MHNLSHASGLAIGLAQDVRLRVRRGRWAYNAGEHVLQIGLGDSPGISARDRGLIGHEIGHVQVSHYHLFQHGAGLPAAIVANLLNAVEDPRVNFWFRHIYPGAAGWIEAMYEEDRRAVPPPTRSLFLQFAMLASIADAWDWRLPARWPLEVRARRALHDTGAARQRYATQELPAASFDVELAGEDLASRIAIEVEPLLVPARQLPPVQTRSAALALISAARAHRLFQAAILPAAVQLIVRDLSSIAERVQNDPRFQRALQDAVTGEGAPLVELVEQALVIDGSAKPGALEHAVFIAFLNRREGLQPDASWFPAGGTDDEDAGAVPPSPRRGRARHAGIVDLDDKIERLLSSQLDPLVQDLAIAFRRPNRWRYRRGFPSGIRIDVPAAMRFSVDRRGHDRLWLRAQRLSPMPEAAVFLLVDLSGSMAGAEIEGAVLGTMLLASTFQRLGPRLRFAVEGFQDERIPFKSFDQPVTTALLDNFKEMAREVAGDRPGGHNQPRYNDDGPCVREAAEILLAQPARQRLLLVVSDGRPEGRRSTAGDLHAAIAEVSRRLHIVGLGLGKGTSHVTEFYPHAVADIPPEDLARAIGNAVITAVNNIAVLPERRSSPCNAPHV